LNLIRVMPAKGQDTSMAASISTSVFLAKLIGPVALVIGLALAFNGAVYRAMAQQFLDSHALVFLAGLITLVAGLATVLVHNVWTPDWRVVVTILGWLWIVGGTVRMVAPQYAAAWGRTLLAKPMTMKVGVAVDLALGVLLTYFGYVS
jgi:hypothetical protein